MNKLLIIGASGHGKVVADIAAHCGYKDIAFLDDDTSLKYCLDYPVIGVSADAEKYIDADFFVAIGNPKIREKMQKKLAEMNIVSLIHPDAVIAPNVVIGKGTAVMAGTVINTGSDIGEGCIINTGATVDHDNRIEDYVHVSVGSHLAGTVTVGKSTWVGVGVVVSNNVNICGGCTIGAGAVVVKVISEPGTYVGVPAKRIEDKKMKYTENPAWGGLP